jgi:putative tricarboxylic transport membrane protein
MDYIIPPIIVLCFVGAYGLSLSTFDVLQVVLSGFMGYAIIKYNYSIVALMMGLILGPIIEENIHRAFQISQGDPFIFVQTPVALILTVAIGISVVLPLASGIRNY